MSREYTELEKEIGLRVKAVRKHYGLSQTMFGHQISLSRTHIAQVETGTGVLSDKAISLLCRVFQVNKRWLLTGNGDMFAIANKKEAITSLFSDVLQNESFKYNIISGLALLDDQDWKELERIVNKVASLSSEDELQ